jgi:hypothetical protein
MDRSDPFHLEIIRADKSPDEEYTEDTSVTENNNLLSQCFAQGHSVVDLQSPTGAGRSSIDSVSFSQSPSWSLRILTYEA